MTTLIWGDNSAPTPVRASVTVVAIFVAACFSTSYVMAQQPIEEVPSAQPIASTQQAEQLALAD